MATLRKRIGDILIGLALLGFLIVSLPFLLSYLPQKKPAISKTGYSIEIPKISAFSPVVAGVDPWNKREYNFALSRGIAQAKGTFFPGEGHLVYLFAHSSGLPWEILDKNIPFLRLNELHPSDRIILRRSGKEYIYTVSGKLVVAASETKYLKETGENVLILQTCWPLGTDWKRLLVIATPEH